MGNSYFCPECGAENKSYHKFCTECGSPLKASLSTKKVKARISDDEDDVDVPDGITDLFEEVQIDAGAGIYTLGDIINTNNGPAQKFKRNGSGDIESIKNRLRNNISQPEDKK